MFLPDQQNTISPRAFNGEATCQELADLMGLLTAVVDSGEENILDEDALLCSLLIVLQSCHKHVKFIGSGGWDNLLPDFLRGRMQGKCQTNTLKTHQRLEKLAKASHWQLLG